MAYRNVDLIALDLDNTLFDEKRIVSPGNHNAIKHAREAGIVVTVCTARMHPAALLEAEKAGIEDAPLVVCNGGYIYQKGIVLYKNCMTSGQMRQICGILDPHHVSYYVSTMNEAITNDHTVCGAYYSYWHIGANGYDDLPLIRYETGKRIVPAVGEDGLRLTVVSEDPQVLAGVREALQAVKSVDVFDSWYNNVEVMAPGGKGQGILELCRILGVDPSRAMAIGDSTSDISMLRAVGYPVAVGNASDALKAIARYETPDCMDDGVAYAIESIALKK